MDVALLRGTYADEDGNVSVEHEALLQDLLNQVRCSNPETVSCGAPVPLFSSGGD
jgi:acyl CoA:acetate/3-ketoacid CoA transferase